MRNEPATGAMFKGFTARMALTLFPALPALIQASMRLLEQALLTG